MATISMSCTFLSTARFANLKAKYNTRMCIATASTSNETKCLLTQGLGNLPKVVSLLFMEGHYAEMVSENYGKVFCVRPLVDCFLLGKLFAVRPSCAYLEVVLHRGKFLAKIPYSFDQLLHSMDKKQSAYSWNSGGVPHYFPQFGPGTIQQHGFARNVNWSIIDSENVEGNLAITLELKDDAYSRAMWDFSFQALYKIFLNKKSLSTELIITNNDSEPFSFTTALHTYFSASLTGASVKGLKGCKTLNKDPDPKYPVES